MGIRLIILTILSTTLVIEFILHRTPTGIDSLDSVIGGGFPSGSLVLLLGDAGAGNFEFAYTSAIMISNLKRKNNGHSEDDELKIPEKVCYISFTKSEADIMGELTRIFNPQDVDILLKNLSFKDLSTIYHHHSITPPTWISEPEKQTLTSIKGNNLGLLEELITYLNSNAANSLVILDSLTNLVRASYSSIEWQDLISFFEGLQRVSKRWDGVIYAILGAKILDENKESELADCADGVLIFDWMQKGEFSRQQIMYVKKFRGLLPQLTKDNISKFETSVTIPNGFEMKNVRLIRGHSR